MVQKAQSRVSKNVIFSLQQTNSMQQSYLYSAQAAFQLVKKFPAFKET
jgi:hypothetical protein